MTHACARHHTPLGACAAAVLDTAHGGILASESQPVARGHAEALIPLVARGMQQSEMAFGDEPNINQKLPFGADFGA